MIREGAELRVAGAIRPSDATHLWADSYEASSARSSIADPPAERWSTSSISVFALPNGEP